MAPYAATYWKYYLIIEQPTPIGCNVHRYIGMPEWLRQLCGMVQILGRNCCLPIQGVYIFSTVRLWALSKEIQVRLNIGRNMFSSINGLMTEMSYDLKYI